MRDHFRKGRAFPHTVRRQAAIGASTSGLQRLLDAEKTDNLITRVFRASRNGERDQPPEAWTAEFVRKARTIIDARCSN